MANISTKYHYFYKITNNLNGHFYYGVHNTNNLDDGYMGSGKRLHYAYKKYGIENFTKEILKYFNTTKEAFEYEAEVVNENLVKDDNCYNIRYGGEGTSFSGLVHVVDENGNNFYIPIDDERYLSGKLKFFWKNKKHNKKSIDKLKTTLHNIDFNKGEKNPQYGTCWINKDNNSIRIKKEELDKYLSDGWVKGRKLTENQLNNVRKKINNIPTENRPAYNTIWIYNDNLKKSIYVKKEELDKYLSEGWIKGRKIKF